MATKVYDIGYVELIDGTLVEVSPLKIKYLRELMDRFQDIKKATTTDDGLVPLVDCVRIAMKQFCPRLKTVDDVEDNVDIKSLYKVLDIAAGIKLGEDAEKPVQEQAKQDDAGKDGGTWDTLDLAKLESEAFTLGIWKSYEELELSLSLPELMTTLGSKREFDYSDKKFLAAMQGVDLDKETGNDNSNAWEEMKARVFSHGQAKDSNDILALQGVNADKAGFGIGMGLDYERIS